jgi:hypothetical protein
MQGNEMRGKLTRAIIVVAAIAAIVVVLACGPGTLLSSNNPTATPTKTPKPTFTITPTPTITPIPTDTPTPTSTATPTPLPTNTPVVYTATPTPIPSDTPTPLPTDTPVPPPTATRRPQPAPTRAPTQPPPPTNTPRPQFAWRGTVAGTFPNCGWTGFIGLTLASNGAVAGDIWVHYWADGWNGDWALSSWSVDKGYAGEGDEKNWDGAIANYARPGTWYACVVAERGSWDCISDKMTAITVQEPCTPGSEGIQAVRIVFQQN